MPCGVFVVTDIPTDKVGSVIAGFRLDSPTDVTKTQQPNGLWTVTATFPPCADGSSPTNTTVFGSRGTGPGGRSKGGGSRNW